MRFVSCVKTKISVILLASLLIAIAGCGGSGSPSPITSAVSGGIGGGGNGGTTAASAKLTWSPPTTNTDGSSLGDLAGYMVYYGTSSGSYKTSVDVGNTISAVINNLTPGNTYYFAVTAYDTAGNESYFSSEVSKKI